MSDSLLPLDWSSPGSSVHGIFQARIPELVCHVLLQEDLPDPGIESTSLAFLALACEFFTSERPGRPTDIVRTELNYLQITAPLIYHALDFFVAVFSVPEAASQSWNVSSSLTSLVALWADSILYIGFHMNWASGSDAARAWLHAQAQILTQEF